VKEEVDQIIVPVPVGPDLADRLATLLRELVPAEASDAAVLIRCGGRRRGADHGGWHGARSRP